MNRAMRVGDPLAVLRVADTSAKWLLATNAVLAWADWKGDKDLRKEAGHFPDPLVTSRQVVPPTEAEWGKIILALERLNEPYKSVLMLLAVSGLRFGDVMHLTRKQAELVQHNKEVHIRQKGNTPRVWAPGSDARKALARLLQLQWTNLYELVDPYPADLPYTEAKREVGAYYRVRKALQKVCDSVGVEFVRFHKFRHALSVAALADGKTVEERQRLLGHANYDTTNKYYTHTEADSQIATQDSIIARVRKAGKT
jgi:integrase